MVIMVVMIDLRVKPFPVSKKKWWMKGRPLLMEHFTVDNIRFNSLAHELFHMDRNKDGHVSSRTVSV